MTAVDHTARACPPRGLLGYGWPDRWPNYSHAEREALELLHRERERLEEVNRWAITQLSTETADCEVTEYLERWRDLGTMLKRAHQRYERIEQEVLATLAGGAA